MVLTSVKTVASSIKRIEGFTGLKAYEFLTDKRRMLSDVADLAKVQEDKLKGKVEEMLESIRTLERENSLLKSQIYETTIENLKPVTFLNSEPIYVTHFNGAPLEDLRKVYDLSKKHLKEGNVIFTSEVDNTFFVLVGSIDGKLSALDLLNKLKVVFNIKGGGNERIAQGTMEKKVALSQIIKTLGG